MKHRLDKKSENEVDPSPSAQASGKCSRKPGERLPQYYPTIANESTRSSENISSNGPDVQNDSTLNAENSHSQRERENNGDSDVLIQFVFAKLLPTGKSKKQLGDFKATHSNCFDFESVNNHEEVEKSCVSNTMKENSQQNNEINSATQGTDKDQLSTDEQEKVADETSGEVIPEIPLQGGTNKRECKSDPGFACGKPFIERSLYSSSVADLVNGIQTETTSKENSVLCVAQPTSKLSDSPIKNGCNLTSFYTGVFSNTIFKASQSLLVAEGNDCLKETTCLPVQLAPPQHSTVSQSLRECQGIMRLKNHTLLCCFEFQPLKPQPPPVLVVDYFPASLDSLINRVAISFDAIRYAILRDIALALNYLHNGTMQIICRDLSAKNVLISTSSLQAKITDYGDPAQTQYRETLVTDSASKCNTSSDIFSFGVLMIQMFLEQPYLNDQAAASLWLEYRQYLEDIGYFDSLLSHLIHSCIVCPQGTIKAVDIVHHLTYLAQWFPVNSTHKQQWLSILQTPFEPLESCLSLTYEDSSSFYSPDRSATPKIANIISTPSDHVDKKLPLICTSEDMILRALEQNQADLITVSLFNSSNSASLQECMRTLAMLHTLPPPQQIRLTYAFLKQICIYTNHSVMNSPACYRKLNNSTYEVCVRSHSQHPVSNFQHTPSDLVMVIQNNFHLQYKCPKKVPIACVMRRHVHLKQSHMYIGTSKSDTLPQNLCRRPAVKVHGRKKLTKLSTAADIEQQLYSPTEACRSVHPHVNTCIYYSSHDLSLVNTVNADKKLTVANIDTPLYKSSQLSNESIHDPNFSQLLAGHFPDHNFFPKQEGGIHIVMTANTATLHVCEHSMSCIKPLVSFSTLGLAWRVPFKPHLKLKHPTQVQPSCPLTSRKCDNVLTSSPTVNAHNGSTSDLCTRSPHNTLHAIEKPHDTPLKSAAVNNRPFSNSQKKLHPKKNYKTLQYKHPAKGKCKVTVKEKSNSLSKLSGKSNTPSPLSPFKSKKTKSYPLPRIKILNYSFSWLHKYVYMCNEDKNSLPRKVSLSVVATRKREFTTHVTPSLPFCCEVVFRDELNTLTTTISFESGEYRVDNLILNLTHVCLFHIPSVSNNIFCEIEETSEGQSNNICRYKSSDRIEEAKYVHSYSTTEEQQKVENQTTAADKHKILNSYRSDLDVDSCPLDSNDFSKFVPVQDKYKHQHENAIRESNVAVEESKGSDFKDKKGSDGAMRDCNNDNHEKEGYFGDGEDSDNNQAGQRDNTSRKREGCKKRKKKRRSSKQKTLRKTLCNCDHPIALVRGFGDNEYAKKDENSRSSQIQQETNHYPPLAMHVVDGEAVHIRVYSTWQPHCHTPPCHSNQDHTNAAAVTPLSLSVVILNNPCVQTGESSLQCTNPTANGSVFVQSHVVYTPHSAVEAHDQMKGMPFSMPQTSACVSLSTAIDSGIGTTTVTVASSARYQSRPLPQTSQTSTFQNDSILAIPARQRRPEDSSNEPRWNYAMPHQGAFVVNDNHNSIHTPTKESKIDEVQHGNNGPLKSDNEADVSQEDNTDRNHDKKRGSDESAQAEEGECLPVCSTLITLPPGGAFQRRSRLQVTAASPQQSAIPPSSGTHEFDHNDCTISSGTVALPILTSLCPVVSSFPTLAEASNECVVHSPNGVRPIQVVGAYQPRPHQDYPPLPQPQAVGAPDQYAEDAPWPLVPGALEPAPIANNALPQQNALTPAVITASVQQAGNGSPFHALVEENQPRELFR